MFTLMLKHFAFILQQENDSVIKLQFHSKFRFSFLNYIRVE